MQAIILAAGTGSRLGGDTPKPMIAIAGKPLIVRLIEQFHKFDIRTIYVVTGHQEQRIREALRNYQIETINNPFYQISDNMVSFWLGQLLITETCMMAHADLILEDEIVEQISLAEGDIVLPMDTTTVDAESMKMSLENGTVVNLSKDIPLDQATGESIPLMKFSIPALSGLKTLIAQWLQKNLLRDYLESPLLELIKMGHFVVNVVNVTGQRWKEIDTAYDLAAARQLFGALK